jgi:hypothetical protein
MDDLLLKCPSCDAALAIGANASPLVMCPICLSSITSPRAATNPPRRVIPINQEVTQDRRQVSVGLIVIACMLFGSIVIPYIDAASGAYFYAWIFLMLVSGVAAFFIYRAREATAELKGVSHSRDGATSVLDYAPPQRRRTGTPFQVVRAIGVMLLTGGLIAIGVFFHVLYLCASGSI